MTITAAPWHGIGQSVDKDANLLEASGLDWTVEQRPLYLGEPVNKWTEDGVTPTTMPTDELVKTHTANYRSDTNEVLAVTGCNYEIFQNEELAALVEAVEDDGQAEVESALSLRGGRDVFFLMKNSSFELPGNDKVHTYHIFGNNHAGERSIYILPTSLRVWCSNMLHMVYRNSTGFKIRHTSSMKDRVADAISQIKHSQESAEKFRVTCQQLAEKRLSMRQVTDYWDNVYTKQYGPTPDIKEGWHTLDAGEKSQITRKEEIMTEFSNALSNERKRTEDNLNAWTALNSVTEWIDHGRTVRGEKKGDQLRVHSNMLGSAAKMKSMALETALAL